MGAGGIHLLGDELGPLGWLVIGAIVVVATILIHPSVRLAQRFLDTHHIQVQRIGDPAPGGQGSAA